MAGRFFYAVLALTCVSCGSLHHEKQTFFRMETAVEVTVVTAASQAALSPLWRSIDSLLAFWEVHFSQSALGSEVRAINQRTGNRVAISAQLDSMIATALAWGDSTGGMFDLTILPIKELWGLGETDTVHRIPSEDALARTLARVNYKKVHFNPARDTLLLDNPATAIDAGGFAKGYALMAIGRLLNNRKYENYLVASGDIICRGRRADGKPWRVGVAHPRKSGALLATLPLYSGAIFTSGDYEHFWMAGSRRIHHIFSPRTGCSCTKNQSLTIHAADPLAAKYLSTGLFCLPADSILSYINKRNLDCVIVDSSGAVFISPAWRNSISMQ